jgi:hypothetical protein
LMRLSASILAIGMLAFSLTAQAQDIERAKQLFQEASSLREAGLYQDAIFRLRQAIAIKDTPGLEYHTGFCEAKLGHYRLAVQYYEHAAALLRDGASAPDVVTLLAPAHASALEHVARLRIAGVEGSHSVLLRLDDEPEQELSDGDILLDPGKHQLAISAPGYAPVQRTITVSDAERLRIEVRLTPLAANKPFQAAGESHPNAWRTVSIGVGIGVTAAGIGLGVASAVSRHDAVGKINLYSGLVATTGGGCQNPNNAQSCTDLDTAVSNRNASTRWETVGFLGAGVGVIATIAIWNLWPRSRAVAIAVEPIGIANSAIRLRVSTSF